MSKLSIIIPVYCNARSLEYLYQDLKEHVLNELEDYEIVFVNDGSSDDSWEVINKIRNEHKNIVAVKLSRNFGEHAAILAGLSICTGDCAVTKQADNAEESELILKMYESWKNGKKVVLAEREDREDSAFEKATGGLYYKLIRKYVTDRMPEGGCDCYLIDRQVIDEVLRMDEMNSSLTLQILWLGYDHDVIKYVRKQRREGEGKGKWTFAKKFKLLSDSFISFTYIPIRLMWIIGLLFSIFAVIMAVIIFVEYFTKGTPVAGWSTLMCVVLLAFGLILWMLGLLGEYIWRIFDSSRNRKPFIIDVVNKD